MPSVKKSKKGQIINMLTLKQKVKCHFMKWGEYVSKGSNDNNTYLFLFSTRKWLLFFISKMNVEKNLVEKLQKHLQKCYMIWSKSKRDKKSSKILQTFASIISSYFHRSSLISKFEKAFEAIKKNETNCRETLKRCSFRKPKKETSHNEQVFLISIFKTKEEK